MEKSKKERILSILDALSKLTDLISKVVNLLS